MDRAATTDRLAQRRGKKPATKAGQLRALWPEIRAAKAEGQSLATIRQWLEDEGGIIVTTVQSPGHYLARIRRKERATPLAPTPYAPAARNRLFAIPIPGGCYVERGFQYAAVPQTKANSSEFGLIEKYFCILASRTPSAISFIG